jgi:4-hydroxybenzoate polyprenyltransferase
MARTLGRCFAESRPVVQVIFMMRFVAGALLTGSALAVHNLPGLALGAVTWALVTFAIYLFNGVTDTREDRVNGSSRPIARGDLDERDAGLIAATAAGMALLLSLGQGGRMPLLVLGMLLLGYLYSASPFRWKSHPGGLFVVATGGGLLTYAAGHDAGGAQGNNASFIILACVMSLWMGFVGAAKDLPDLEGDIKAGRRPGSLLWGERRARLMIAVAALGLGTTFLTAAVTTARTMVPEASILLVGAMAVAIAVMSPFSYGDRSRRRRPYRAFMLTQYGVHAVLFAQAVTG